MSEDPTIEELKEEEKAENGQHEHGRSWTEEVEVAGSELVDRVRELIEEGNVRRLIIRKKDGNILLEIPLMPAAAVGGILVYWNPVLAALGAMAALIAEMKIEIVRTEPVEKQPEDLEEE